MKKLVTTFVKYPFYANLIIAALLIGGLFSLANMKMSFFPERSTTDIMVTVVYPGASPKEMEEGVTIRIEQAIRGLVGIKEVNSTSSENYARVQIVTTGEYDIDESLMEVKNAVDGITGLPVDAERPIVYKQRPVTNAVFMSLTGNVDLITLKRYADEIEDDLYASGVVSQLSISGYPQIEISVEVTEDNLMRYGLTFDQIQRAIYLNNRDISAGLIRSDDEEILIRSRARKVDPDQIADIVLRANPDGSIIRIRDIGTVKMKFADVASGSYMNGTQSVSIQIRKLGEEDLAEIVSFTKQYVEDFNSEHQEVQLTITYNFLELLNGRLQLLYKNGGIGLLLVLITLGLFLSLRLSFWVAWGIPASFLGMFMVAVVYGVTINMISLFGMILVVGILVDDGIVIAENIYTHFEQGKSPRRAAIDGTMEVLPAVATSVTTTIIAFLPLFFLSGRMEFMFEMAFVVVFSLLFSLVEAFFVLPAHLASPHIMRSKDRAGIGLKIRKGLDKGVDFMRYKLYGPMMRRMINWRGALIITPVALILITAGLFRGGLIQATFFPSIPFDFFNVYIAFTPGSGEKQTLDYLMRFEEDIWKVNEDLKEEFNDTADFVNYTFVGVGGAFEGTEVGSHAGSIFVLLRNLEDSPVSSFEIVNRVREEIGDIPEAEKFLVGGRSTFGTPVSVSLLGKDLEELQGARDFMMARLSQIEEIKDITDNNAIGKREVQLELKPRAYFMGLNHADISNQVRQGFFGGQAQRLQIGKDEVRVWVRYPKSDRINLGQMENMKIKVPGGEYPLTEVATYEIRRGPVNIQRFNSSREVRIDAELVDPYEPVPPLLERIRNDIIPVMTASYPGVRVEFQGQQRDSAEAGGDLLKYYAIAFLLMVMLIMIHFKSFSQGSIVLLMIPLGWLGAIWGHAIEGIPVSMLSAWGMVALSGVIVNDAVVFLSKYNSLIKEGKSVQDAAYEAGLARFRAIMLTTITTVAGLYPIILETSFQAQFLIPMAVSLAYGVMIGTGFILIFFPILIVSLSDLRVGLQRLWTGVAKSKEELEPAYLNNRRDIDE